MGKNNRELLKMAESHVGEGGARFRRFCGLPAGAPYCNAFVCYVFDEGDDERLYFGGKRTTYCPTSIKWCQAKLANIPLYLAMPMDVIYFDWQPHSQPDHIGFVRERKSDTEIYTVEGNTSMTNSRGQVIATGVVANKTRPLKYICGVYRPYFRGKFDADKALDIDGAFEYNSIACLRKALGMKPKSILSQKVVKRLQKKVGVTQDGSWGVNTSKAIQRMLIKEGFLSKGDDDGYFGKKSVMALQKWINKKNGHTEKKPTPKPKKRVVKIGQAACNENGKAIGGKAGDQTGKEVALYNWTYSATKGSPYHWEYVFRAKDKEVAKKIAKSMREACANDHIGYDLDSHDRGTLFEEAKKVGWDISKVTKNCETSCVDLVSVCCRSAGIKTPKYWASVNVYKDLMATDKFKCFTSKEYVASSAKLEEGDILVSPNAPHSAAVAEVVYK